MPRAKPPPKARPMTGVRSSGPRPFRDSSLPKACTDRMIFPRLFTGTPRFYPRSASDYVPLASRMPRLRRKLQTTLVLHELRAIHAEVTVLLPPSGGG